MNLNLFGDIFPDGIYTHAAKKCTCLDPSLRKNFPFRGKESHQLIASAVPAFRILLSWGHTLSRKFQLYWLGFYDPANSAQHGTPLIGVVCSRAPCWVGQEFIRSALHSNVLLDQPSFFPPLFSQELTSNTSFVFLITFQSTSWKTQLTMHGPALANLGTLEILLNKLRHTWIQSKKLNYPLSSQVDWVRNMVRYNCNLISLEWWGLEIDLVTAKK